MDKLTRAGAAMEGMHTAFPEEILSISAIRNMQASFITGVLSATAKFIRSQEVSISIKMVLRSSSSVPAEASRVNQL